MRIGSILFRAADVVWQRPAVGKDFSPCLVVLPHFDKAVRHCRKRNSTWHKYHGARESQGITGVVGVIRIGDGVLGIVLMCVEDLLAPRRHRRDRVDLLANTRTPEAGEIALGSGTSGSLGCEFIEDAHAASRRGGGA